MKEAAEALASELAAEVERLNRREEKNLANYRWHVDQVEAALARVRALTESAPDYTISDDLREDILSAAEGAPADGPSGDGEPRPSVCEWHSECPCIWCHGHRQQRADVPTTAEDEKPQPFAHPYQGAWSGPPGSEAGCTWNKRDYYRWGNCGLPADDPVHAQRDTPAEGCTCNAADLSTYAGPLYTCEVHGPPELQDRDGYPQRAGSDGGEPR
jgi:hypothetical protein